MIFTASQHTKVRSWLIAPYLPLHNALYCGQNTTPPQIVIKCSISCWQPEGHVITLEVIWLLLAGHRRSNRNTIRDCSWFLLQCSWCFSMLNLNNSSSWVTNFPTILKKKFPRTLQFIYIVAEHKNTMYQQNFSFSFMLDPLDPWYGSQQSKIEHFCCIYIQALILKSYYSDLSCCLFMLLPHQMVNFTAIWYFQVLLMNMSLTSLLSEVRELGDYLDPLF